MPNTWVTLSPVVGGRGDAVEGVFGNGRKTSVCGSAAGWRADGKNLQGVGISRKGNYPAVDSTPDVRERAAGNCLFMGTFTPARGPERRAIREAPGEPRRFLSAVRRAGSSRAIFARQLRSTKLKAGPSRVRRILSTLVFRP